MMAVGRRRLVVVVFAYAASAMAMHAGLWTLGALSQMTAWIAWAGEGWGFDPSFTIAAIVLFFSLATGLQWTLTQWAPPRVLISMTAIALLFGVLIAMVVRSESELVIANTKSIWRLGLFIPLIPAVLEAAAVSAPAPPHGPRSRSLSTGWVFAIATPFLLVALALHTLIMML